MPPDTELKALYVEDLEIHHHISLSLQAQPRVRQLHECASCSLSRVRSDAEPIPRTEAQGDLALRLRRSGETKRQEHNEDPTQRPHQRASGFRVVGQQPTFGSNGETNRNCTSGLLPIVPLVLTMLG